MSVMPGEEGSHRTQARPHTLASRDLAEGGAGDRRKRWSWPQPGLALEMIPILLYKSTGGEWFSETETERQALLLQREGLSKQQTLRLQLFSSLEIKNLKQFVKCHVWFMAGAQLNKSHLLLIPRRRGRGVGGGGSRAPAAGRSQSYTALYLRPQENRKKTCHEEIRYEAGVQR